MPDLGGNGGGTPTNGGNMGNAGQPAANPVTTFVGSGQQHSTNPSPTNPTSRSGSAQELRKLEEDLAKNSNIKLDLDTAQAVKNIEELLRKITEGGKKSSQAFERVTMSISEMVDEVDDANKALVKVSKLQREMGKRTFFDNRSIQETLDLVDDYAAALDKIKKKSKDSWSTRGHVKELEKAEKELEVIQKKWNDVKEAGVEASKELQEEFQEALKKIDIAVSSTASKMRSNFGKAWDEAGKDGLAYLKTIGGGSKLFDVLGKNKHIGKLALAGGKDVAGGMQNFAAKAKERQEKRQEAMQAKLDAWKSNPRGVGAQMLGKGFSPVQDYYARKVMGAKSPEDMGVLGRAAMRGGGSVVKGIGQSLGGGMGKVAGVAGDLLGGAGGMLGSIAGKALPVLAVAQGLAAIFDETSKRNKAVEAATAQGGLMNTGGPGASASNLTSFRSWASKSATMDMSWYGQDFQKNLDMLKSTIEDGFSVSLKDIQKTVPELISDFSLSKGATQGAMGARAISGVFGSRTLGLTSDEGIKLTNKLMTKYQQSAKDTVTFFSQVSKESQVAGISTTKYIGIIEGLTDNMDGLNKSFLQIVMTVERMGKSGRFTADQLKSMGESVSGMGKNLGVEASAFVMSQPGALGGLQSTANKGVQNSIMALSSGMRGVTGANELLGMSPDEMAKMSDEELQKRVGGMSNLTLNNRLSNNQNMSQSDKMMMQGMIEDLQAKRATAGALAPSRSGVVGNAVALNSISGGFDINSSLGLKALKTALGTSKMSLKEYLENPGAAGNKNPVLPKMLQETFHMNTKDLQENLLRYLSSQSTAITESIGKGEEGGKGGAAETLLNSLSKEQKKSFGITGKTTEEQVRQLSAFAAGSGKDKVSEIMTTNTDLLEKLIDTSKGAAKYMAEETSKSAAKRQEEAARKQEAQTKSTADVFARSFEYLFTRLFEPLNALRDFWFKGKEEKAQEQAKWLEDPTKKRQLIDAAEANIKEAESRVTKLKENSPERIAMEREIEERKKDVEFMQNFDRSKVHTQRDSEIASNIAANLATKVGDKSGAALFSGTGNWVQDMSGQAPVHASLMSSSANSVTAKSKAMYGMFSGSGASYSIDDQNSKEFKDALDKEIKGAVGGGSTADNLAALVEQVNGIYEQTKGANGATAYRITANDPRVQALRGLIDQGGLKDFATLQGNAQAGYTLNITNNGATLLSAPADVQKATGGTPAAAPPTKTDTPK